MNNKIQNKPERQPAMSTKRRSSTQSMASERAAKVAELTEKLDASVEELTTSAGLDSNPDLW